MSRARTQGRAGRVRGRSGRSGSSPEPASPSGPSSRARTSRARAGTATLDRPTGADGLDELELAGAAPDEPQGAAGADAGAAAARDDDHSAEESSAPLRGGPRLPRSPRQRMLLACTAVLALGLLGVLMLNTIISQGAFRQFELEVALTLTAEKEEALAAQVDLAEAPKQVEKRARALGMVPAASPVFLRLSDGKVLGEPVPAAPQQGKVSLKDAPGILPTPKPSPSASATDPAADPSADPGANGAATDGAAGTEADAGPVGGGSPSPSPGADPSSPPDSSGDGAGPGDAAGPSDGATADAANPVGGQR